MKSSNPVASSRPSGTARTSGSQAEPTPMPVMDIALSPAARDVNRMYREVLYSEKRLLGVQSEAIRLQADLRLYQAISFVAITIIIAISFT